MSVKPTSRVAAALLTGPGVIHHVVPSQPSFWRHTGSSPFPRPGKPNSQYRYVDPLCRPPCLVLEVRLPHLEVRLPHLKPKDMRSMPLSAPTTFAMVGGIDNEYTQSSIHYTGENVSSMDVTDGPSDGGATKDATPTQNFVTPKDLTNQLRHGGHSVDVNPSIFKGHNQTESQVRPLATQGESSSFLTTPAPAQCQLATGHVASQMLLGLLQKATSSLCLEDCEASIQVP